MTEDKAVISMHVDVDEAGPLCGGTNKTGHDPTTR